MQQSTNPYSSVVEEIVIDDRKYSYYSLAKLNDQRVNRLPFSIRILLEQAVRNCDNFSVKELDVQRILGWEEFQNSDVEIAFKPARVILQDLTGVPLVVDLAAMRSWTSSVGKDPQLINPLIPVDLVIDHSVQVDFNGSQDSKDKNEHMEFERNIERFQFLKWGQRGFKNFSITPPGSGIVHQVNLESIARVVFERDGLLYPDSVVGTDSHTTMINGLGVLGWGVGGIEAEANMLGETTSMVLPQVVGFRLTGELSQTATATDLVLTCTELLRKKKVVGKFVEFFGPGVSTLTLADRATVSNMAPEYGATMGFFPVDGQTLTYLRNTGRTEQHIQKVEKYLKAQGLFLENPDWGTEVKWSDFLELDLSTVKPCIAGPKRPQDRVEITKVKEDFLTGLSAPVSFKGYGLSADKIVSTQKFTYQGKEYVLKHGSVVMAAITSCTNTSNPSVMISAGLLAKNAVEKGLSTLPYIKTSLSPGSQVVTSYFEASGLTQYLDKLNFNLTGYGCMTCIGNSGPISEEVSQAITSGDLVVAAVLSGNRNFEGRVHPLTRANYLASPPLVVAYALAGRVDIDFETEPIGFGLNEEPVFLKDIWPSLQQVRQAESQCVKGEMFLESYGKIQQGTQRWNNLQVPETVLYEWNEASTYINHPPYFKGMTTDAPTTVQEIKDAYCLALFGDSITTDHISPAGNIAGSSPAAKYLLSRGVVQKDFNTYGSRRGHDEVMVRGTFANVRIKNKMLAGKEAPHTIHVPTKQTVSIYDAAALYKEAGIPQIIIGGAEYGSGSSRDWAAKGPYLQGVKAVIAISFERIHRSNLAGMGVLPLEFLKGETPESLGLTGFERFSIHLNKDNLKVNQIVEIEVQKQDGEKSIFKATLRLDTDVEIQYYLHGGILQYVLRKIVTQK